LHGRNKCFGVLNYVVFLIVGVEVKFKKSLPIWWFMPPLHVYSIRVQFAWYPWYQFSSVASECLSSEFTSNSWQEDVADCRGVSYMSHALYNQTRYLIYVSHMDQTCPMKFDLKIYIEGELHITSSSSLFSNFKISQVRVARAQLLS
jgi:hypothetical protein